jgi:hypothetical protein
MATIPIHCRRRRQESRSRSSPAEQWPDQFGGWPRIGGGGGRTSWGGGKGPHLCSFVRLHRCSFPIHRGLPFFSIFSIGDFFLPINRGCLLFFKKFYQIFSVVFQSIIRKLPRCFDGSSRGQSNLSSFPHHILISHSHQLLMEAAAVQAQSSQIQTRILPVAPIFPFRHAISLCWTPDQSRRRKRRRLTMTMTRHCGKFHSHQSSQIPSSRREESNAVGCRQMGKCK